MTTYRVHLDSSDLTFDDDTHGGAELMQRLHDEVYPTVQGQASKFVGSAGSPGAGRSAQSVEFFETISGAPKGTTAYDTTRRNFQRYANAERTPKLATVEGYQARYELKNGERSPILDNLIRAAGGEVPEETADLDLPPGKMEITVMSTVAVITGKKKKGAKGDVRTRAIPIEIGRGRQKKAADDPLGEWTRGFEDYVDNFEISDIQWMEVSFTPTKDA